MRSLRCVLCVPLSAAASRMTGLAKRNGHVPDSCRFEDALQLRRIDARRKDVQRCGSLVVNKHAGGGRLEAHHPRAGLEKVCNVLEPE